MSVNHEIIFDKVATSRAKYATLICTKNPKANLLLSVLLGLRKSVSGDVILIDDGSDNPITQNLHEHIDVLIRIGENVGVPRATNVGLEYCSSKGYEVCFRNDDDDIPLPGRGEVTLRTFAEHENCVLVAGLANDVIPSGESLRLYGRPGLIRKGNKKPLYPNIPTRHSTFALHLKRLNNQLRYDPAFDLGQDYKLLFDALELGDIVITDEIFVDYLTGPSTRSYKSRKTQLLRRAKLFVENGDWRLPVHYLALTMLFVSIILPEKLRPIAWNLLDLVSGQRNRKA